MRETRDRRKRLSRFVTSIRDFFGDLFRKRRRVAVGSLRLLTVSAKTISAPLARRFDRKYRDRYRFAKALFYFDLTLLAVALVALAISVSYFLMPIRAVAPLRVVVYSVPSESKNGDAAVVYALVTNKSKRPVKDAALRIKLPDGFVRTDLDADGTDPDVKLGDLPSGAVRVIGWNVLVMKTASSTVGSDSVFATIGGTVDGAVVTHETSYDFKISGSAVSLEPVLPISIRPGSTVEVPVAIRNSGPIAYGPVALSVCAGQGGRGAVSLSGSPSGCRVTSLGELNPFATATTSVRLVGKDVIGQGELELSLISSHGERTSLLATGKYQVVVSVPELEATLRMDDEGSAVIVKTWTSGEKPQALEVFLDVPGRTETRLAGASDVQLKEFSETGALEMLVDNLAGLPDGSTLKVVKTMVSDGQTSRFETEPIPVPASLGLSVSSSARYFSTDGEQLGRGPLPPQVGEATEYWVFWNLGPIKRGLAAVDISANLSENVRWIGKQNVGVLGTSSVVYDPTTRTVSLDLKNIPQTTAGQGINAAFAVSFVPTEADRGKMVDLVGETDFVVKAADGGRNDTSAPAVTTELAGDTKAAHQGVVE